jgi:hypothetical protein
VTPHFFHVLVSRHDECICSEVWWKIVKKVSD